MKFMKLYDLVKQDRSGDSPEYAPIESLIAIETIREIKPINDILLKYLAINDFCESYINAIKKRGYKTMISGI